MKYLLLILVLSACGRSPSPTSVTTAVPTVIPTEAPCTLAELAPGTCCAETFGDATQICKPYLPPQQNIYGE